MMNVTGIMMNVTVMDERNCARSVVYISQLSPYVSPPCPRSFPHFSVTLTSVSCFFLSSTPNSSQSKKNVMLGFWGGGGWRRKCSCLDVLLTIVKEKLFLKSKSVCDIQWAYPRIQNLHFLKYRDPKNPSPPSNKECRHHYLWWKEITTMLICSLCKCI